MSSRRFWSLAILFGLAVGVTLTWPLVLHLDSKVLDDGTYDAFQFAWNVWWVRESLVELQRHPFSTHHLYYPDGVPLLFHTGSFALGLVSLPLQLAAGALVAANAVVLTAPALTVVAVAALAREVTGDPWAALAAGLLGAITPFAIWVLPVMYLSCGWIPPALLALWWVMQRRREWRLVAAAVALLGFSVFASQEYAMMSVALLGLDVALRVPLARRLGFPPLWVAGTAGFFALAGALLGTLALVALANPAQPPRADHALLGSGFVRGFLTPPWLEAWLFPFARVYFLGTATLVLAAIGLWLAPRRSAYWALLAVPLLLMVMGPYLHMQHPFFALPPKRGDPPLSGIPGPYLLAGKVFPLLKFLRAPYRWMAVVNPTLAVLGGIGIAALRARVAHPAPRVALTALLLLGAAAVPTLESRGIGATLVAATVPPALDVVVRDPQEAALIDLPSGYTAGGWALLSSRYMFYQTAHRKFLLEGTVSRLPPDRHLVAARRIDDFAKLPYVKWVVVHRDVLEQTGDFSRKQAETLADLALRQGRLVAQDETVDVYQLDTFRPEAVWSPKTRSAAVPVSAPASPR